MVQPTSFSFMRSITMTRLLLCISLFFWGTYAFTPASVRRGSLDVQSRQSIAIYSNVEESYSFSSERFDVEDEDEEDSMEPEIAPMRVAQKKKSPPKRKSRAAAPVMDASDEPEPTPKVATKLFYRAKEDDELYAVSSIAVGSAATLKDFKKMLVEANEWSESSKIVFYTSGEERLALTTSMSEVLPENSSNNPLFVSVMNKVESTAVAPAAASVQMEQQEVEEKSISLYETSPMMDQQFETPMDKLEETNFVVKKILAPEPQLPNTPMMERGVTLNPYSEPPPAEWSNRMPVGERRPAPLQATAATAPALEETGRYWMNKISLDLGVVLVAKVMKALERSQFLVLAAPGGYGKTSLLQLLERVYEKQGKCVVRFRIRQDADVYHQFQTSSGIDLKNAYIHDLRPNYQKVILIDDAHKVYDTPGFWEVLLKKFPTWCFAWDYTIILAVTLPVPQGAPIIELLGDPTIPHLGPKDFMPDS